MSDQYVIRLVAFAVVAKVVHRTARAVAAGADAVSTAVVAVAVQVRDRLKVLAREDACVTGGAHGFDSHVVVASLLVDDLERETELSLDAQVEVKFHRLRQDLEELFEQLRLRLDERPAFPHHHLATIRRQPGATHRIESVDISGPVELKEDVP